MNRVRFTPAKPTQYPARVAIVALIAPRFGDWFNPGSW